MMHGQKNINPLNAELNPICRLLALLGAHPIFHVSRIRVKLEVIVFKKAQGQLPYIVTILILLQDTFRHLIIFVYYMPQVNLIK